MYNFVMYCKTYSKDFNACKNMVTSFNEHNKDNIKLYISVPEQDLDMFNELSSENIFVITDESYSKDYFITYNDTKYEKGWLNQQICKLSFWENNFTENYLCIDSDAIFIRDFYLSDFMKDEVIPYTVLVQDKDLHAQRWYLFSKERKEYIKKIWDYIDYKDTRYRTCHGFQIMNLKVLKSLKQDFMIPKHLEYQDLIKLSPLEFSWYNAWFQKSKLIEEYSVEPFFKTFHYKAEFNFAKLQALSLDNIRKEYIGIILNSNWAKNNKKYPKINIMYKIMCEVLSKITI